MYLIIIGFSYCVVTHLCLCFHKYPSSTHHSYDHSLCPITYFVVIQNYVLFRHCTLCIFQNYPTLPPKPQYEAMMEKHADTFQLIQLMS